MTINGLNSYMRKNIPEAYGIVLLRDLAGRKIAIDAHGWMYSRMAVSRKKVVGTTDVAILNPNPREILQVWLQSAFDFVRTLLSHRIIPIFIFDGESRPEKKETREERDRKRREMKEEADQIAEELASQDILERSSEMVDRLRQLMSNFNYVPTDDITLLRDVLDQVGIPNLKAKHDAEQLCSMLCIEGKVAAVFSNDSDNIAFGCPLMVTGFDTPIYDEARNRELVFKCIQYGPVATSLGLEREQFIDVCVMAGCDFNTNLKGIAFGKSLKHIRDHGSIEAACRALGKDPEPLRHEICRKIFTQCHSSTLIVDGTAELRNPFSSVEGALDVREMLEALSLTAYISDITRFHKTIENEKQLFKPRRKIVIEE